MRKIMFAAMAALAITGCSQSEEMDAPSQKVEIGFNSFVGKATRAKPMATADFTNFKVYAYNTGDTKITGVANVGVNEFIGGKDVTKELEVWTIAGAPYYWPLTDNLQFFAYSPKDAVSASDYAATGKYPTFDYTVKTVATQEDLLAALTIDQTKENATGGVTLTFKHLLTQINFSVKGSTAGYTYTVKKIEITDVNSKAKFTFASDGGSWSDATLPIVTPYQYFSGAKDAATESATDFETGTNALMLMPQTLPAEAKIVVDYDVKMGSSVISENTNVKVPITGTWAANQKVRYTLTLSDNGTEIVLKPSVGEWAEETQGTTKP